MRSAYTFWASPTASFPPPPKLLPFSSATPPTKHQARYPNDETDPDCSIGRAESEFTLPGHVKSITSTSNPFVRHCVKLARSSPYRQSYGSTLVVGTTPIREIHQFQESLPERTVDIEYLFLLDGVEVPRGLENCSARVLRVSALVLKKLSQIQSTESLEAIALMKHPTSYFVLDDGGADCTKWFRSPHRILVLEGIQDPGNLGALLRSAVAFKWGGVFLLPGCTDPFGGKALRASRGAAFQIPIVSGSWHHLESLRKELRMKMLAGHPDSNVDMKPVLRLSQGYVDTMSDTPLCLLLGSEGFGLSEKAYQDCELVSIPMAAQFESLNVAVAGGIFLYMLGPKDHRTV